MTNPDRRARCRALSRASTARGVSEPHDSNQREVFNLNSTAHNLPRTGRNETNRDARNVTSGGVRHAYMRLAKIRYPPLGKLGAQPNTCSHSCCNPGNSLVPLRRRGRRPERDRSDRQADQRAEGEETRRRRHRRGRGRGRGRAGRDRGKVTAE